MLVTRFLWYEILSQHPVFGILLLICKDTCAVNSLKYCRSFIGKSNRLIVKIIETFVIG